MSQRSIHLLTGIYSDPLFFLSLYVCALRLPLKDIKDGALWPAGEVAGRINDIPTVKDLIDGIMKEAEEIIRDLPSKFIVDT